MMWTHLYDLVLKLVTMFLVIVLIVQVPVVGSNAFVGILLVIILFFVSYYLLIRTLATYLYCKLTLKMNLRFKQAKKLNDAISPVFSLDMQWLPMTEIKALDDNIKYKVALNTYAIWKEEKQKKMQQRLLDFKAAGQQSKTLTVVQYVLVAYIAIASFMNLPPANYLTIAFCKLFDTDKYYPILNSFLLIVPTLLIFKVLGRKLKR